MKKRKWRTNWTKFDLRTLVLYSAKISSMVVCGICWLG